jgi:plastocyanin
VRRWGIVAGVVAALAVAPPAFAQQRVIQAVDGTEADGFNNRWSPAQLTIRPGETVTWSFAGTSALHNVASNNLKSPWNPTFRNGNPAQAPPSASYTFATPGTYRYLCEVHANTMFGDVVVTDSSGNPPPPPPPPPLSQQPFPNDADAPGAFEVDDALAPRVSRVKVRARRHGASVRFRLDEPAMITVRVKRARITVKRRRYLALKGRRAMTFHGLRAGRYRIEIAARDLAGNQSRVRRVRLTVH